MLQRHNRNGYEQEGLLLARDETSPRKLHSEYNPRVVAVPKPARHYRYLLAPNGDWLGTEDGETLRAQGHVDDAAIWQAQDGGFKHVATGLALDADDTRLESATRLRLRGKEVDADGGAGPGADFTVGHGPEKLPSAYLGELNEQGWVSLTCVLPSAVLDGLQKVGGVDAYEGRERQSKPPLAQHPAVAKVSAEPISLWLTRMYLHTQDIRLGHAPNVNALPQDDGAREVQGWHTDFPYLWGTGDRIPLPSGDLVLGMQRNVCVSDFRKDNGATLFKLGSHRSNRPPPLDWGRSTQTYRRGNRANFGLPYGGPEADVIEAPAGTIILYDARTWHRAGMNSTARKRGAMIQAIVPGFIMPFMDTSATYKAFLASDAYQQVTERERKELERLLVHKIAGPAGVFAITVDEELTARVRRQPSERPVY